MLPLPGLKIVLFHDLGGVADREAESRNIFGHYGARPYDRLLADCDTWYDYAVRADPNVFADGDRLDIKALPTEVRGNILVPVGLPGDKAVLGTDGPSAYSNRAYDYAAYPDGGTFFKDDVTMPGVDHTLLFNKRSFFEDKSVSLVLSSAGNYIEPRRKTDGRMHFSIEVKQSGPELNQEQIDVFYHIPGQT